MSIRILQGQAQMINSDLDFITKEIHAPKNNLQLNEKTLKDSKKSLKSAMERQKSNIKFYADDEKRYNILKKYGEVLQLVEKLLGLIPSNLANLSIEEMEEKLKELLKTRKKNEMQLSFMFYQNLITDLMTNLLSIEKDFQDGKISSKQAYQYVQLSKIQIKDHAPDMPPVLQPALQEASHLVKLYENSYQKMDIKQTNVGELSVKDTDVELRHEILFDKLNSKTKDIISSVTGLSTDLSNFEPQVDLSDLNKKLNDTNSILETENFDVDRMKSSVEDLERTTINLTDKQVDLNKQNETLASRINECTSTISETTKLSMKEISRETFLDMSERAETNEENTEDIKELIEDEEKTPTSIASQTANTILAQVDADNRLAERLAIDPNADTSTLQKEKLENVEDVAELLNEEVLTTEEKREIVLTLKHEIEEGNPPQDNK